MKKKMGRKAATKKTKTTQPTKERSSGKAKSVEDKEISDGNVSDVDQTDTELDSDVSSDGESAGASAWNKVGKKGKKVKRARYICKGCNKAILSNDNEVSVECESCEHWFHPECQGLCRKAFNVVDQYNLFWICIKCRKDFAEKKNERKQVKMDIDLTEKHIIGKIDEVKTLVTNMIDKKVDDGVKKMEMKIGESSTILRKAVQEKSVDRTRNLIVHNLPESESSDAAQRQLNDTEKVNAMISTLCGSEETIKATKTFRLRRKQETGENEVDRRPRLIMVKLEKAEEVEMLLRKRFQLREHGYPNIFLSKDLSKEEREKQWKLREELKQKGKETHKIFQGRVVPRE